MKENNDDLTAQQRKFVEALVQGLSQAAAYRLAYRVSGKSEASVNSSASRLAKDVKVLRYRRELEDSAKGQAIASRKEVLEFHTSVLRTPISEVREESPLCQKVKRTDAETSFAMVDKLGSARELSKMLGYYEPEQVQHSVELDAGEQAMAHLSVLLAKKEGV